MQSYKHSLQRTSLKGQPFIGTCTLCGKPGLTFADMTGECENQRGLTQGEAVVEAIKPGCTCCGSPDHTKLECIFWKP